MNPDPELLSAIKSRLRCTPQKQRVRGCCIFKTPSCLQEIEDFYTIPQVVSLGLYHVDPFQFINEAKIVYLKKFLLRSRHNIDHFIVTLNGLFNRIVHCYQQSESSSSKVKDKEEEQRKKRGEITKLTPPEVSIIMLSDGAFLIEFLRRHIMFQDLPLLQDPQDPIFSKGWLVHGVFLDMLKMENQIPFFVLRSLAEEWFGEEELFRMLFRLLKYYNGLNSEYNTQFWGGVHILEFFSNIMFSFSSDHNRSHDNGNHHSFTYTMPSVTQLLKSGIKLNTIASSSPILNINYNKNKRVLCIPKITLNQATCILITNTVAYELCRDDHIRYCADYVFFMHRLLKEPTDVELLLEAGVLTFGSVEDWRVTRFLCEVAEKVVYDRHSYLGNQVTEIQISYASRRARINRKYFSKPWSWFSAISAVVVLVTSIIQTVFTFLMYFRK
ncbi:hypothetical protein Dsin_017878 [Dipteronia sinensis]|uniref:Uncharacterized protein n=1 Tax=Dipteronia sinensis TaxID=43782 RepID=A0AAE0E745_9ROSI|nr:hypothetical protein Dsin_017878 [Dipteronia sinensis]